MELPSSYVLQMKKLLGENYPAYRDSFYASVQKGLRVNELKLSIEEFLSLWSKANLPELTPIPWIHNGFFIPESVDAGKLPFYQAGLYYIQEPAAMTPAENLPIAMGDRVLDLCAAPGGKSTELLAKLRGTGVLISNDISQSRAKALKKNLEMAGARNAYVTAETPEQLSLRYAGYFDKILIDAPCSGEGMFRTQPQMIRHWEEQGPEYYAKIQKDILEYAWKMLSPGGMIMYSTCTFARIEDEDQILQFLAAHPDLSAAPISDAEGFEHLTDPNGTPYPFVRLYPHRVRGEGQFAALLQKSGERPSRSELPALKWSKQNEQYLLPGDTLVHGGLHYLMTGLHLGTEKNGRFQPSQAYAMTLSGEDWPDCINLSIDDPRVEKYLKGETLDLRDNELQANPNTKKNAHSPKKAKGNMKAKAEEKQDTLVLLEGYPLGFARRNRSLLKNKRAAGWRTM